jgi:hypothetical protein
MAITPEEIALLRQKIREKNRPTDESRRRRLKELLKGRSLEEALSTTPSGIDEIARNQQIIRLANSQGLTPQPISDVPLDLIQDDTEFGTGDLLMNDRAGLDIDNPIGQAFEEDILSPSSSGPQSFLRNLVLAMGDNEMIQEALLNEEMAQVMAEGIGDQPSPDSKKEALASAVKSKKGVKLPTSTSSLDNDTMALMSALRAEDLGPEALQADITAGIGEQFMGRRPSMTLTGSGQFGGGSADVAKAVLAQKIKERNNAVKLQAQLAMANQRADLERQRLGVENFKAVASALDKKERQKLRQAKNKMSAARSLIKGYALENRKNVIIDPDTKQVIAVKEGKEQDFDRLTKKIQLINRLIGSLAGIDPEVSYIESQAELIDDIVEPLEE